MSTIEELVVAARPEGIDETTDELEDMEGQFDETADSMEDTTEQFGDLQQKWQGAMGAIVAGLAVAVGGVLNQVPILGAAMEGLGAIMGALGFQLDQLIRDLGGEGLITAMFDVADAIFEAEGATGDLIGALTGLASIAVIATAAIGGLGMVIPGLTAAGALGTAIATVKGFIATLVGIVSGSLAAAAGLGALLGVFGVAVLEITGVMDKVRAFGQMLRAQLPAWARDGLLALIGFFTGPLAIIGAAISGFVSGFLEGGLQLGIQRAVSNAEQVLDIFISAWQRTLDRIRTIIGNIISEISSLVDQSIGGINVGQMVNTAVSVGGDITGAGGGGGGGGGIGFGARRSTSVNLNMDGRNLVETDGRYRRDQTSRRGTDG